MGTNGFAVFVKRKLIEMFHFKSSVPTQFAESPFVNLVKKKWSIQQKCRNLLLDASFDVADILVVLVRYERNFPRAFCRVPARQRSPERTSETRD